jgi:DNA-binding NarL/FixJ family response regulator
MLLRAVDVVARGGRFVPPELRAELNQPPQRQQSMRHRRLSRASAKCSGWC